MNNAESSTSGLAWLRPFVLGVLAVLALLSAAAYVVPLILPQTMVRSIAAEVIAWGFGHPVAIAGETRIAVLPRLTVEARHVSAVSAGGDGAPVLFDIPYLLAEMDTLGVAMSRIHIHALHMRDPVFRPGIDRAGRANWRRRSDAARPDAMRPDHEWGIFRELQIDSIKVSDGRVVFEDRRSGYRLVGEKVGLLSSNPVNTEDGPGLLIGGGAVINGERFAMKFETGQASKFISGNRLPVVIDIVGAPLSFRFQGGAARRQFFVTEGTATMEVQDLARLDRWLGGIFAAPVGGPMRLSANVDANGPRVRLENAEMTVGNSQARGFMHIRRDADGRRHVEANIKASLIDLSPFVPSGRAPAQSSRLLAALYPDAVDGRIAVEWNTMHLGGLRFGGGSANVGLGSGRELLDAEVTLRNIYEGAGNARLRLGLAEGMTSMDLRLSVRRLGAEAMLADALGQAAMTGLADVSAEFLSVGSTPAEVVAALRGKGRFNLRNGELLDANLVRHLGGKAATALPFHQLVGSFTVNQGVIRGDDLLLRAPRLSLIGSGAVDLARDRIDMDLRTLDQASAKDGIRPVKPFRVEGPLTAFEITPR